MYGLKTYQSVIDLVELIKEAIGNPEAVETAKQQIIDALKLTDEEQAKREEAVRTIQDAISRQLEITQSIADLSAKQDETNLIVAAAKKQTDILAGKQKEYQDRVLAVQNREDAAKIAEQSNVDRTAQLDEIEKEQADKQAELEQREEAVKAREDKMKKAQEALG